MHMTYQSKWHQRWTETCRLKFISPFLLARAFRNVNRARVPHLFTGFFSAVNREPSDLNSRYREKRKDEGDEGEIKGGAWEGSVLWPGSELPCERSPALPKAYVYFNYRPFLPESLRGSSKIKKGRKIARRRKGPTITFNIRSRVRSLFFVPRDDRTNASDILNIPRISFSFLLDAATFRCASAPKNAHEIGTAQDVARERVSLNPPNNNATRFAFGWKMQIAELPGRNFHVLFVHRYLCTSKFIAINILTISEEMLLASISS